MLKPTDYVIDDGNASDREQGGIRGLIPRNYSANPVGSYEGSVTFDKLNDELPLIPWEDMPDMIADKVANKSQLSDIRDTAYGSPFPSLDQNGQGYCLTEDTEYLTQNGWVSVGEYDGSTAVATIDPLSNRMEFQYPSVVHRYEYSGEMIYSTNRRIDFGVTPNHRMYVRKWDENKRTLSDQYSFMLAKDIGWYVGLLDAPTAQIGTHFEELAVPGFVAFSGDDFFALLGLIVSDGFAGGAIKNQNVVSFANFRGDDSIKELAVRCGFRPKESNPSVWLCTNHAFANWVRENCYCGPALGAKNKQVPLLVKAATPRQIEIFLKHFDDRNRTGSQFYSGSKKLIDDLQELHMRIGKRSSIGIRDPRTAKFDGNRSGEIVSRLPQYVLTVASVDTLCIDRKKHIEQDRYNGNVFCVTVPNGTVVTRRNGSVMYSGNCWFYSGTGGIMLLRAKANMPYVRLSAHAGAWVIKNGRDQGGWGAQGLDFQRERGVPSVKFWAEKSMDGKKYNTPETWENAALHKVSEGFIDLDAAQYDRKLSAQQVLTCLIRDIPVIADYNDWGHSTILMDAVDAFPNLSNRDMLRYGVRGLNSWTDQWGANGTFVRVKNKAIPNGSVAPRAVVVSDL